MYVIIIFLTKFATLSMNEITGLVVIHVCGDASVTRLLECVQLSRQS